MHGHSVAPVVRVWCQRRLGRKFFGARGESLTSKRLDRQLLGTRRKSWALWEILMKIKLLGAKSGS